jgi:hypothetical protein
VIADDKKPGKRFHVIYEETKVLVRSGSLETIGRALLSQLELLLLLERDDALYAEMSIVAFDGRYALVPPLVLPVLETFSYREIQRSGIVLPYSTTVAIDPGSGELVPMPRVLDVAPDALEQLPGIPDSEPEPRVAVGRPLRANAVVSFGSTTEVVEPISKAQALYRAASHSLNLERVGVEVGLEGLRKTVEPAGCFELGANQWKSMLSGLASILRP